MFELASAPTQIEFTNSGNSCLELELVSPNVWRESAAVWESKHWFFWWMET